MKGRPVSGALDDDQTAIDWLLEFLRADLASLAATRLITVRQNVFVHLHETSRATVTEVDRDREALRPVHPGAEGRVVIAAARDLLTRLQTRLREGLNAWSQNVWWSPFAGGQASPSWSTEPQSDGTIRRVHTGSWFTITTATAVDVLMQWWPRLRRCQNEACRVWFLPAHGRQYFHDERCASQARYQRYKPKRNYKDEYARRYADRPLPLKTSRRQRRRSLNR